MQNQLRLNTEFATYESVAKHYLSKTEGNRGLHYWQIMCKNRMNFIWQFLLESPNVLADTKAQIRVVMG